MQNEITAKKKTMDENDEFKLRIDELSKINR